MKNKINIAELLKDSPKGMELYSPIFGEVYLDKIIPHLAIRVTTDKKQGDFKEEFLYDGRYRMNGECMLFPSKDQRDWSKFQRPFKDGDIVATKSGSWIGIVRDKSYRGYFTYAAIYVGDGKFCTYGTFCTDGTFMFRRLATEEEKQILFDAIKANGYKWNAETKTLEELIEPKFKVGDRIRHRLTGNVYKVLFVLSNGCGGGEYDIAITNEIGESIDIKEQDNYELVPNKFDITTLVSFESRVLVRDYDNQIWIPTFWGKYLEDDSNCRYLTTNGCYKYCIPDEGNHHLLGTTNDCDEYYKTW